MKSINSWVLIMVLSSLSQFACPSTYSQAQKPNNQNASSQDQPSPASEPATARPALAFGLAQDTPIKLKLSRTISSSDAKVGESVTFEVVEDIKIGDVLVIQHGASATAIVTEAKAKGLTHSGKLNMNIEYVQLVSGDKLPLRATKVGKGGNQNAAATGAMIATSVLFFPVPMLLSKDVTIPQGTEIAAYVASDTPLDPAKFANAMRNGAASASSNSASTVSIKSTPDGADITVDDKFVGTTPSTVQLAPGDHRIVVSKSGFKTWQRTMTVNPNGSINLNAELEKLR